MNAWSSGLGSVRVKVRSFVRVLSHTETEPSE